MAGYNVIIAGSGYSSQFLKTEFPELEFIKLSGFKTTYAPKPFFLLWILFQLPFFGFSVLKEHVQLKKIIKQKIITKVISDNRYGLWNKGVESILITHQVFIQLPKAAKLLEPIVHWFTKKLILKFNECWIPDYQDFDSSLAGNLSHGKKLPNNAKYIGPLSRFQNYKSNFQSDNIPDVLVLISGPEPHRSLFEKEIENRFKDAEEKVLLVCGKPSEKLNEAEISNIKKVAHLKTNQLHFYLKNCKHIISRCGYTTLMDLHVLNCSAELSSTPGQTEQEYLTEWLSKSQITVLNQTPDKD